MKNKIQFILFLAVLGFLGAALDCEAATPVYYSIGQNATDHKTCTGNDCGTNPLTVTIASGTATFSVAQTAYNLGVGDRVTYNTDNIAYISGKTSTTVWSLITATGGTPADITDSTVVSIAHEYTSLSAAEAGATDSSHLNTTDLAGGNYLLNFPCYYDTGPDPGYFSVSGYSVGPNNFIKIYTPNNTSTEVNKSQRHDGTAGTGFFIDRGVTTSAYALSVSSTSYTVVEGLEITNWGTSASSGNRSGVSITGSDYVTVSHNLIHTPRDMTGSNTAVGINVPDGNYYLKIFNNIIYNIDVPSDLNSKGIIGSRTNYIYNNTIINSGQGINQGAQTTNLLKNNISVSNVDGDYVGTFAATSTNNISSDTSSPNSGATDCGGHSCRSQTVLFEDTPNKDFHLSSSDTAARNSGADLSADGNLVVSNDIDGNSRPTLGVFDIGADEGATKIFRSVGPGATAALDTGAADANQLTISGSTATFTIAVPDNVGVGDAIQYDDDGDSDIDANDSIVFIHGRTDDMHYTVKKADGTEPTAVAGDTDWSIFRAYSYLFNADAGIENTGIDSDLRNFDTWSQAKNLVASNEQWNTACYANGTTDDALASIQVNGFTTSASNYIRIYTPVEKTEVGVSQRHNGKWDETKYKYQSAYYLNIYDAYTRVEGLQVRYNGSGNQGSIAIGGREILIKDNIIRNRNDISDYRNTGIYMGYASPVPYNLYAINNIVYECSDGIKNYYADNGTLYAYNNTVYDVSNMAYVHGLDVGTGMVVKNNIAQNCGVDCYGGSGAFTNSDYNISDLSNDAPSASYRSNLATDVTFADETSKDFHLSLSDTSARNVGANLSADANLAFSQDIDGDVRTGIWDIGADETITPVYYSVGQNATDHKTCTNNNCGTNPLTVTIASGTATFSVAQTAYNLGVGDRVTYNTDNIAYISGKTSTTVWSLITATGGTPADITDSTVVSIAHEYTSLSAAIAGALDSNHLNTSDLSAGNYVLNIPCYYDTGADTTAVTVSGYTTSAGNYIKIYTPTNTSTEVNSSQRHQGLWSDIKYQLNSTANDGIGLGSVNYVTIDGIQIRKTSSSGVSRNGINLNDVDTGSGGVITISNNILRGELSGTVSSINGIVMYNAAAGPIVKIYNNIIYGWVNGSDGSGITLNSSGTFYAYNNTIYNGYLGLAKGASGTFIAKNNVVQNATTAYFGTFDASSSSNISNDATSPNSGATDCGGHSCRSQTVLFEDTPNKDFHLSSSDTAARNSGADLSADGNLVVSNDIDGNSRPTLGVYDIGADEGATKIFRSVGPGATAALDTGAADANQLTISGSTATFTIAVPDNVGVGDAIQYDDDGDSDIDANDSIVFIHGRTDEMHYTVKKADGTDPTAVAGDTDWSIFRAYLTLGNAEGGSIENTGVDSDLRNFDTWSGGENLFATNKQWNIACYVGQNNAADGPVSSVAGWNTNRNNYLRIYAPNLGSEVGQSQRHQGRWDETKYRLESATYFALWLYEPYIWLDGIQLKLAPTTGNPGGILLAGNRWDSDMRISNNIIRGDLSGMGATGSQGMANASVAVPYQNGTIWNNVFYGWSGISTQNHALILQGTNQNWIVYNNTVYNSYYGIRAINANVIAKNNLSYNNAYDFAGSFNAGSTHNLSKDATAPAYGAYYRNATVQFADETNNDFHLSLSDTAAKNKGANLSADANLHFDDDVDGDHRDLYWSIGADEGPEARVGSSGVPEGSKMTLQATQTDKLTDGLVGMWSFDGPDMDMSTNTAYDRSPVGTNHGTVTGAKPVLGKKGQALSFDGSGDYVSITDSETFNFGTSPLTISSWVKFNSAGMGIYQGIVSQQIDSYELNKDNTNRLRLEVKYGDGTILRGYEETPSLTEAGRWYFVSATFLPSDGTMVFYVNGILKTTTYIDTKQGGTLKDSSASVNIGQRTTATLEMNGAIDEVRIYNRALTAEEVGDLYNLGQVKIRQ